MFAKLFYIVWQKGGGPPVTITTRQISAIVDDDGYALAEAFPAIGYPFPVTDCKAD